MRHHSCEENQVEERTRKVTDDLRARGYRVTLQRVAIVREFVGRCDHPSAEALHQTLATEYPMMALSTVYNTLRLLAGLGEAVEVTPATPETRFDPDTGEHCHLTCLSCGCMLDLPLEACAQRSGLLDAARDVDFEPVRGVYQIFGYCSACREEQR